MHLTFLGVALKLKKSTYRIKYKQKVLIKHECEIFYCKYIIKKKKKICKTHLMYLESLKKCSKHAKIIQRTKIIEKSYEEKHIWN